jgi:hypothetical protein
VPPGAGLDLDGSSGWPIGLDWRTSGGTPAPRRRAAGPPRRSHRLQRVVVVLRLRDLDQVARIGQPRVDGADLGHHVLQRLALLAELLRALGVVPDVRRLQQAGDLGQPCFLGIEVEDTPKFDQPLAQIVGQVHQLIQALGFHVQDLSENPRL